MTQHSTTRLEQGGITSEAADNSVPLVAASYTHPALTDRIIVRLIPEALVEAEDLALGVTGIVPRDRVNVGHIRRRAIGFPAWPILTDPANAHHALNLITDLERAGRYAHTKPKRFKEIVDELATKLDNSAPHFLPTFLEEAGRICIAAENPRFAAQMFTLARDAEKRHRLPIDEERHLEAVMEFAYAGAMNTKELSNEAKRLAESMEPAEAYQTYRTLCVERVRGGLTPHAGMKKELAKLASAAGLDPAAEERTIAKEMLRAASIQYAGTHFWKNYEKAICQAVAEEDDLVDRLLSLTPYGVDTDVWLNLLSKTGALDKVKEGNHPDFVPRILWFESILRDWPPTESENLASVLADILPHAGLKEVPFPHDRLSYLPAAVVEQVAASGIPFAFSHHEQAEYIALGRWARRPDREPLPHLAADESLREDMIEGITACLAYPEIVDTLASDPHLRPLVLELLGERVEKLETGIPPVELLTRITGFVRGFEHVNDPEIQSLLDRVRVIHRDPAVPLAESLRRGLPDELGWPELEQAQKDYGECRQLSTWLDSSDCWPGVIVENRSGITYLRGRTSTTIPNWTGNSIFDVKEVDGQFGLATYHDNNPRVWWPEAPKGMSSNLKHFDSQWLNVSVPVPGGRLFAEGVIMRPGQSTWARGSEHFFVDGERVWLVTDEKVLEIDPNTGATGRASLPDWMEGQRRRHPDLVLDPQRSQHRPVTDVTADSPFSTATGYHRHAVFTRPDDPDFCLIVDADGTEYTVTGASARVAQGTLRRPGGGTWILSTWASDPAVVDPDDLAPIPLRGTDSDCAMWWHHTRVREQEVSDRLRSITADDVRPLIDHAHAEQAARVTEKLCTAVGDLLGLEDPVLRYAIACVVHDVTNSWPQPDAETQAETLTPAPTFAEHRHVVDPVKRFKLDAFDAVDIWKGASELGLHDRHVSTKPQFDYRRHGSSDWMHLLGFGDALLALAAIPGRTAEEVQGLKELWTVMRDAGVLGAENLVVETYQSIPYPASRDKQLPPQSKNLLSPFTRDEVIVRAAGSEPVTAGGQAVPLKDRAEIPASRTDLEPVFDALLERISAEGPLPWSPEPGEAFAAATGSPLADAHLIMAGFPNFRALEVNFLSKELRTAMGLKVDEAKLARERLWDQSEQFLGVLAAGVPEDASTLLDDGLDTASMAQFWSQHGPAYLPALPPHIADRKPKTLPEEVTQRVVAGRHADGDDSETAWAEEMAALFWVASELDLSDPLRPVLADYAERLHANPRGIDHVMIGVAWGDKSCSKLRRAIGVPERVPGDESHKTIQSGRFTLFQESSSDWVYLDFTGITDPADPDLAVAREWARDLRDSERRLVVQAAVYHVRGALTAFAEWLRQPGDGEPRDPLVSAPGLVAEAAAALGVSEDAARYYLQLLAWPDPTDANVRRWNNWKKADITRAGDELVAADVVVAGKRPRSGRSFFLMGGWIDATAPELPIELWKLSAFAIEPTGYRGVYEPQLGIPVAPLPPPDWFAACWERSQGEDAPRFAELETTRRRRR